MTEGNGDNLFVPIAAKWLPQELAMINIMQKPGCFSKACNIMRDLSDKTRSWWWHAASPAWRLSHYGGRGGQRRWGRQVPKNSTMAHCFQRFKWRLQSFHSAWQRWPRPALYKQSMNLISWNIAQYNWEVGKQIPVASRPTFERNVED